MPDRRRWRWLELAFLTAGLAAAASFVGLSIPAVSARIQTTPVAAPQNGVLSTADSDVVPATLLGSSYGSGPVFQDGTHIGTLEIPALHLSAPVIEGVGDSDLRRGIGHVPGSAQSGGLGNVVLAAHRDTVFRPLRDVRKGMDVRLSGGGGTYTYRVDSTQVVAPDRLDVLEISNQPEITLITCYPFNFVGSAPMRFIVKAHLLSVAPTHS